MTKEERQQKIRKLLAIQDELTRKCQQYVLGITFGIMKNSQRVSKLELDTLIRERDALVEEIINS